MLSETRFVKANVQKNFEKLQEIRIMSSLLSGIGAGVLGLTGIYGFLFFIVLSVITSCLTLYFGCKGSTKLYLPGGKKPFFDITQIFSGCSTFLFVWTVTYDAIHLF